MVVHLSEFVIEEDGRVAFPSVVKYFWDGELHSLPPTKIGTQFKEIIQSNRVKDMEDLRAMGLIRRSYLTGGEVIDNRKAPGA